MGTAEHLDFREESVHPDLMRGIYPPCQAGAGYIPKLREGYAPHMAAIVVAGSGVDIELVKRVIHEARDKDGKAFSIRGLARAAKLGESDVRDILRGKNKNPTTATLLPIAKALGGDLSLFGLSQTLVLSQEKLRDELEEALAHIPVAYATPAEQAEYLAEAVASAVGLPKTEQEASARPSTRRGKRGASRSPASAKV